MEELVSKVKVIARAAPDTMVRFVETLQEMGKTVAIAAEGTNSAPAMK